MAGAKLLLEKPNNQKKTFSALQFGGSFLGGGADATSVFAPAIVGQQKGAMEAALDAQIDANDGATNYNAAFALRKTQNPNANRIIFMTDGGHNIGDYDNASHQGGPPVDVVGFSPGLVAADQARLQQIANETKGTYHPLERLGGPPGRDERRRRDRELPERAEAVRRPVHQGRPDDQPHPEHLQLDEVGRCDHDLGRQRQQLRPQPASRS